MLRSRPVLSHHPLHHIVQCFKSVKALLVSSKSVVFLYFLLYVLLSNCNFSIQQMSPVALLFLWTGFIIIYLFILNSVALYPFWTCGGFVLGGGSGVWKWNLSHLILTAVSEARYCLLLGFSWIHKLLSKDVFKVIRSGFNSQLHSKEIPK